MIDFLVMLIKFERGLLTNYFKLQEKKYFQP
jgi:hypothetical protein